ncbi:MAG: DUF4360 domain-containing protein [Bacteriovoracaceae bacterium]
MKKLLMATLFLSSLMSAVQTKADDISLGIPGYGGNGCPGGSASITLSPDKKTLSLIFDSFIVEAGGGAPRVARKNCNIAIPVHIPQGFSVSLISADYRGFNALPSGATAKFVAEYFFAGFTGPRFEKSFYGSLNSDYFFQNNLGVAANVWSPCGQSINLRVNTSMMVQANYRNEYSLSTVDTADYTAGLVYHLKWMRC